MGRNSTSLNSKVKQWLSKIPEDQRKFFQLDGKKLICTACCKGFEFKKEFEFTQHARGQKHISAIGKRLSEGIAQPLITEPLYNEFQTDLLKAFLSADIPLSKIVNPAVREFIEKYCKRTPPSQSTLRRNIDNVYNDVISKIREEVGTSGIWLGVDETTDKKGRFIANIVVGSLRKHAPSKPHLLMSRKLEATNNATITQVVMDALNFLWPGEQQQEIGKRFVMLLTDAVPYMLKAGRNLKRTYPELMHVTCLAHGLNRVAETARSLFNNADKLMAAVKAVFKKAPSRVLKYIEMNPDLALPPEPVLTRWGTWLSAANFYCTNFENIKKVLLELNPSDAECIRKAQTLIQKNNVKEQFATLSANFTFIADSITKLESRKLNIWESVGIIENVKTQLESSDAAAHKTLSEKLESVLSKNPDYGKVVQLSKILKGDPVQSTDEPDINMDPEKMAAMKFCPLTSVEVERSFSIEKAILTDRRQRFTLENLEKVVVCHFEFAIQYKLDAEIEINDE